MSMNVVRSSAVEFLQFVRMLVCGLFLCLALTGCRNESAPTSTEDVKNAAETSQAAELEACRRRLSAAIRRLEPEAFALQSNPERSVNGLNAWIKSCGAAELNDLPAGTSAEQLLDANAQRHIAASVYTANDASYIRDCWLLRDLTNSLSETINAEGQESTYDGARVEKLFEWIVRNISLMSPSEERIPLGLFDVMLIGRGTAEDRAWVFGEALRQQQIDAVIVSTDVPPGDSTAPLDVSSWIVAVLLNDRSLLFDMASGLPVTTSEDFDPLTPSPADLKLLAGHERWKNSRAMIVAQTAAFAPRMYVLQDQLAAEDASVLYEELGGVSDIRPITERIVAGSQNLWKVDSISIWPYPEQQVVASQSLPEEQQKAYGLLMRAFDAPFERDPFTTESSEDLSAVPEQLSPQERQALVQQRLMEKFMKMMESSEEMFGKPSRRLLKARIMQLAGGRDTGVIQQLQQIRIAGMEEVLTLQVPVEIQQQNGLPPFLLMPFPQLIRQINQSSTGAAMYWTAGCQIDRGEVGSAITTLMNYRRQYPDGIWKYPSLMSQARCLLIQERKDDAVAILKEADQEENPERWQVQRMLKAMGVADVAGAAESSKANDAEPDAGKTNAAEKPTPPSENGQPDGADQSASESGASTGEAKASGETKASEKTDSQEPADDKAGNESPSES
ncbi:MAG: hypothetical protein KDA81_14330 [Planctomycetaceae bacterium]|nr:hypothetical protein [Planctomycetaceae bacterium]